MKKIIVLLLLTCPLWAQTNQEMTALRKQVEEQAAAIAELRAALAEIRKAPAPALVPAPAAAPDLGEVGPTTRASVPRPVEPLPLVSNAAPGPLALRLGSAVTISPYGMVKLSAIRDSNSSSGDDFPFFARVVASGPEGANTTGTIKRPPDFRFKARSARLGVDVLAPDPNERFTIQGKLEFDFEGSFPISTNRTIGSLRASEASIREAWVQLSARAGRQPFFLRFGQAASLFASSTQPTGLETSGLYMFQGNAQERVPGFASGLRFDLGGAWDWRVQPEGGLFLSSGGEGINGLGSAFAGNSPAPGQGTLGFGQREGPNSDRPSYQGRMVVEFEPWKGRRVAPSQFISSFEFAERRRYWGPPFQVNGLNFGLTSASHGYTGEFRLASPWWTLLGKYYRGADLRFYFAGMAQDLFFDGPAPLSTDGPLPVQRPVRAQGGFMQLQLPLSAWFQPRNPRLHGFSLNMMYGYDSAFARDARRAQNRKAQHAVVGSFLYQYNRYLQFGFETNWIEALYTALQGGPARNGRVGTNLRFEFATTFTF